MSDAVLFRECLVNGAINVAYNRQCKTEAVVL